MNEANVPNNPLELNNECTVEESRRWIVGWGKQLAERDPTLADDVAEPMQELLDQVWEGNEPRPSPHELLALMSLTDRMGQTGEDHEVAAHVLLLMLSMPEPLRKMIQVNVDKGSCRLPKKLTEAKREQKQ